MSSSPRKWRRCAAPSDTAVRGRGVELRVARHAARRPGGLRRTEYPPGPAGYQRGKRALGRSDLPVRRGGGRTPAGCDRPCLALSDLAESGKARRVVASDANLGESARRIPSEYDVFRHHAARTLRPRGKCRFTRANVGVLDRTDHRPRPCTGHRLRLAGRETRAACIYRSLSGADRTRFGAIHRRRRLPRPIRPGQCSAGKISTSRVDRPEQEPVARPARVVRLGHGHAHRLVAARDAHLRARYARPRHSERRDHRLAHPARDHGSRARHHARHLPRTLHDQAGGLDRRRREVGAVSARL